ncbi:hypothetical protein [Candidatus Nitrosacidococcus tergens]|uniref:Amidophosphoribosyltransferase (Modular protein) n=1 Tax=Candidatus Nitrosacidococcus tergens TaxID=553981 RepID=A0A7G1QA88_9GAMM|nr:hypothetical protein [Candidatus Nitrosacidococcus tergens]CAB1276194.1 Amidophosphoribosyltransferase (modular protein) [Candidatus Nitrosacidococcus tergens]
MATLFFIAIVLVVYLYDYSNSSKNRSNRSSYFNNSSATEKQKVLKGKQELEQKQPKERQAELTELFEKVLTKRKQELDQKQRKERQARLEKVLKGKQELEQRQLKEQQAELEFKNKFTIYANNYLTRDVTAFYHADYHSGGNWRIDGTIENMIWTIKNDVSPFPYRLPRTKQRLEHLLLTDLPKIRNKTNFNNLTVCVVPRSKAENHYRKDQLLFREIISLVVDVLPDFSNGTKYIIRHTNTRTTHLDRNGQGGDGNLPYPGITKNTCTILTEIQGKDILLIDDLYTKSVNIDEDAIQALLDNGANSVTFYSIGKTVLRN